MLSNFHRDKMTNLKNAKEAAADMEKSLQNRIAELNKILEERDHEIIVIGKKIMKVCHEEKVWQPEDVDQSVGVLMMKLLQTKQLS